MRYKTPYEVSVGDIVTIDSNYFTNGKHRYIKPDGFIGTKTASPEQKYMVLINYIKGETDAKGFTPKKNRTILVDGDGNRTTVYDYRNLELLDR